MQAEAWDGESWSGGRTRRPATSKPRPFRLKTFWRPPFTCWESIRSPPSPMQTAARCRSPVPESCGQNSWVDGEPGALATADEGVHTFAGWVLHTRAKQKIAIGEIQD